MEETLIKNTERVKRVISELDGLKIEKKTADKMFNEGNKLLDECIEVINEKKFKIEEVSLKTGNVVNKKIKLTSPSF